MPWTMAIMSNGPWAMCHGISHLLHSRSFVSTQDGDDDAASKKAGPKSLKSNYLAKVLSPVIGYGTDYTLFQFVYD